VFQTMNMAHGVGDRCLVSGNSRMGRKFAVVGKQSVDLPLTERSAFPRSSWINVPFFLAGELKIFYDLLLYKEFVSIPLVEERS